MKKFVLPVLIFAISVLTLSGQTIKAKDFSANPIQKDGWILDFNEEFNSGFLDKNKFSDLYLTHWTNEELAKANYDFSNGSINLKIDQNQQGWRPGTTQQISSIQTGMRDGLHIFDDNLEMSGHHRPVDCYKTKYGYFELRAKAQSGGGIHSAWWMIGDQSNAERSAEIDIFEILGKDIHDKKSKVWVTLHPWRDPDMYHQRLNYWVDADIGNEYHIYGLEWTKDGMKWYFDNKLVRETKQSPNYEMYTLLGIYQSFNGPLSWTGKVDENQPYPKVFSIDYFRVYKTKEMLKEAEDEKHQAAKNPNIAAKAICGGDFTWNWDNQVGHLNDGNYNTTLQSKDGINCPANIYLDFQQAVDFEQIHLYTWYGASQGITDFDIEYSENGIDDWILLKKVRKLDWQEDSTTVEKKTISLPKCENAKSIRIKVLDYNKKWNHFAINEIEVN